MNPEDYNNFVDAVDRTFAIIRKPAIEEELGEEVIIPGWFNILSKYSFEQVMDGLNKLTTHPESKYGITPALIVECMAIKPEREKHWQSYIEGARKPKCPMDVLMRMKIKSFNLDREENKNLKHFVDDFLEELPETIAMAQAGGFSPHEIVCMLDHGVEPSDPFMVGMDKYQPQGQGDPLRLSYRKALNSPQHIENLARIESRDRAGITNEAGRLRAQQEIAKALSSPKDVPEIKDDNELNAAEAAEYERLMADK